MKTSLVLIVGFTLACSACANSVDDGNARNEIQTAKETYPNVVWNDPPTEDDVRELPAGCAPVLERDERTGLFVARMIVCQMPNRIPVGCLERR